jgi:predicted TIM-barrel fold metal-dependent hydrolase
MHVDVNQHIWTAPLLDRLAARDALPLVRRDRGVTVIHSANDQPFVIDVESERHPRRASLLDDDGLDLAVIAVPGPIGLDALAREDSLELIDAHLAGVATLGPRFAAWGPLALDRSDPDEVDLRLHQGCIGISLPAGALADLDRLALIGPILERVARRRVPLFVHPGPGPGGGTSGVSPFEPLWWRALTDSVSQMQAAWLSFAARGRHEHPELTVIFSMLAGGAPLISERLVTRGGPAIDLDDPRVFYETSSYGPAAIEMMARRVGESRLVYGSGRPTIEPVLTGREALLQTNGAQLVSALRLAA